MGEMDRKLLEELESDFHKISSKEGWEPCDITKMKDLQKLMYYIEVRAAMNEGTKQYPGYEYMDDDMSYRGRDRMGRYTSGRSYGGYDDGYDRRMWRGRSMNMDPYYDGGMSGRRYYDNMGGSGRMYYDSDKDTAMAYLHRMMDSENRPEMKSAMQSLLRELEAK